MYLHGSFINRLGQTVTVYILTRNDRTDTREIGSGSILFGDDPVTVESSVNDSFDVLLCKSAKVTLQTREYLPGLFCPNCTDAVVNIYVGDVCVFAGFIEPQAYSQSFNEVYDDLELNCIDALSALQYRKYKDIGAASVDYDTVKASSAVLSFAAILSGMLSPFTARLDIAGGHSIGYLYDGSKCAAKPAATASSHHDLLGAVGISEILFFGDDEDDTDDCQKIAEDLLKYLDLHIMQEGLTFYVFSLASLRGAASVAWRDIYTGAATSVTRKTVTLTDAIAADTDASISVGEVYNQIRITCSVEEMGSVIESPLSADGLISPYTGRQRYVTEYSADGEGQRAYDSFFSMLRGEGTDDFEDAKITDWYIQIMDHPAWRFPDRDSETGATLLETYCQTNTYQERLLNHLATKPGAAIISIGSVDVTPDKKDNAPVSKVDMKNTLVVSVNGNGSDTAASTYPTEASLLENAPLAVYTGSQAGGAFTPADADTTNYIVISGEIGLTPVMKFTGTYNALRADMSNPGTKWWHKTVPSRNNADGRYYTQYFQSCPKPTSPPQNGMTDRGLVPFTDDGPQEYEFKYSAIGDSSDTISKVSVLACMLIIGDKCVVETGTQGQPSDFTWKTYKSRGECADDDEYYAQCFYIGFDPKIGDKLIGTMFRVQNNITIPMGLDTEGMAIPIKKSDKVSGQVRFMILGPVNVSWGEITRRHRTWFRSEKWSGSTIPLMAHVGSIVARSLEIKVYSDNGHITSYEDNDLVYMSDTDESYVNRKDVDFRLNSALTSAECAEIGVQNGVSLSTPTLLADSEPLHTLYDCGRDVSAKPEQLYVDSYYTEFHLPRVTLRQKIDDKPALVSPFFRYTLPAIGKTFYVQGITRNLISAEAELNLKEI